MKLNMWLTITLKCYYIYFCDLYLFNMLSRRFVSLNTVERYQNLHVSLDSTTTEKQLCRAHWPWMMMCHIPGRSSHILFAWETFSTGGRDTQSDSRADIRHIWGRQEWHTWAHIGEKESVGIKISRSKHVVYLINCMILLIRLIAVLLPLHILNVIT